MDVLGLVLDQKKPFLKDELCTEYYGPLLLKGYI